MTDEVGEESKTCNYSALEEYIESHAAGEDAVFRVSRFSLHYILFTLFHTQSQGRETVSDKVEILNETDYIDKGLFESIYSDCTELIKILMSITKTQNLNV